MKMVDAPACLKARDAVVRMKRYHPPLSGREGVRLDFNENSEGCSPRVVARLKELAGDDLARYPERGPTERLVAEHFAVQAEQLLLTNGVDEAIHLLCETYLEAEDEAIIVTPCFNMYEIYAQQTGASVVAVHASDDFKFPLAKVLQAVGRKTKFIALASPNNPTGTVITGAELRAVLHAAPQAAVLLDEAYCEFHGRSELAAISEFPNLFITRTLSKAYGLAAFRAGVLMGSRQNMEIVRKVSSPYNVNGMALACIETALRDEAFLADYVRQVKEGRAQLCDTLRESRIQHWPSEANFVLMRVGLRHREFVAEMRQRGVLVRDRSSDAGCEGCVRISLGTRTHNLKMLAALREVARRFSVAGGAL